MAAQAGDIAIIAKRWKDKRGSLIMAAEIDLVPANPGSIAFHRKYGFVELGTRTLDSGKIVSMQVTAL